jgi:hypothetical protein
LNEKSFFLIFFSSVDSNDLPTFDDDIPASALFFSVSGSTYRRRRNSSSPTDSHRFCVCVTVPILEHLHEVNHFRSFA